MGKTWKFRKPNRKMRKTRKKRKTLRRKENGGVKVVGHVFSDSCFFCNAMKAEWVVFKSRLVGKTMLVKDIGEDYEGNIREINKKYNINLEANGLPTIFRIIESKDKKHTVDYYKGERTADLMMKWLIQ